MNYAHDMQFIELFRFSNILPEEKKMKKMKRLVTLLTMVFCLSILICGCNNTSKKSKTSDQSATTAVFEEDTELGEGSKVLTVSVIDADGKTTKFTIHSDATYVGEALTEHNIIAGDASEFGLYIKEVNGIKADYDVDKAYWSFLKSGEYMSSGVDTTEFSDGDSYELVYTKE